MATRKKAPKRVEMPRRSADEVTEGDVKAAVDILTMDYYNDVRSVAKDLARSMKDGDLERDFGGDFQDALHQAVDGTQRITYTFQAKCGLLVSDNADAYSEEFGEEGMVEGGNIAWERLAFAAMQRDVEKELDVRSVDVNDPSSWPDIDMSEFD
jgi:hypothetical protein